MKVKRCYWANGSPQYIEYHDQEWGVPVNDDQKLFEFLILEGAQAGLSWSTILNKRESYREAFDDFDPQKVARYSTKKIGLLLKNPGLVRNRLKIASAVTNAQCFLELQQEYQGFSRYLWSFVDNSPLQNHWTDANEIPPRTELSDALSKDLKRRGFKFVGSTICYAYMQAIGLVNDHIVKCFRYQDVKKHGSKVIEICRDNPS